MSPLRRASFVALAVVALAALLWFAVDRDQRAPTGPRPPGADAVAVDDAEPLDPTTADETTGHVSPPSLGALARTIHLEVLTRDDVPIVAAEVSLARVTGPLLVGLTDASGMLTFETDGRTTVSVRALGYRDATFAPPDAGDAREIGWTVALDEDPTATAGGVVWSAQTAVVGALVVFLDMSGAVLSTTTTDERGRFAPADGTARFFVAHVGHGVVEHPPAGGHFDASRSIALELPASAWLAGHVRDSRGAPVSGARVRASPDDTRAAIAELARRARQDKERGRKLYADIMAHARVVETKSADGDGSFRLGPVAPSSSLSLTASNGALTPAHLDGLTLSPGQKREGLALVLDDAGFLLARVTDRDTGAPLAGATISVARAGGHDAPDFGRGVASVDGEARIAVEPQERLLVTVSARGYLALEEGGLIVRRGETVERGFALRRAPKAAKRGAREYTGIGTSIRPHDDGAAVIDVFDGPARGTLVAGDVIVRVDGEWLKGLPLAEVVERIKGEPGSDVELTVRRQTEGGSEELTLVVPRERIEYAGR